MDAIKAMVVIVLLVIGGSIVPSTHSAGELATWYCGTRATCTAGYGPGSAVAAIDRKDTPYDKGDRLRVTSGSRHVDVLVVDVCACAGRRVIDLSASAFASLAPLSRGVIPVTLERLAAIKLPDTSTGQPRAYTIRDDIRAARHDRLRWSPELYRAARHRAVQLARAGALDHHRGMGWGVYREHWRRYGEVLAWQAGTNGDPHWFTPAWLGSPTHRSVLLGHWSAVGVSCRMGHGNTFCVAVFGLR